MAASGAPSSAATPPPDNPGDRAVWFVNNLTHTGDYAGVPFKLREWQENPIRDVFGTLNPDGTRRYQRVFEALPRKQGKTEKVAGVGLFCTVGQRRRNQQVYTAAGDTKQASLIFKAACEMIRDDADLDQELVIYGGYKRIEHPASNSFLEVLSAVPKSKHGLGPTVVLIDELHVVNEELVNVLTTGFGARRDPLTWMITTAGNDITSYCYEEWQYALAVRDGTINDPTYYPIIYAADPNDDWHSEETWRKAMPALGDFCSLDFIRKEHEKACNRPRFENTFKTLYLNLWVEQAQRWLSIERWKQRALLRKDSLEGFECFTGLDIGQTGDMSAHATVVPNELGGLDLRMRYWVPRDGEWRDERQNRILYPQWEKEGWLTFTEGEATDNDQVEQDILAENDLNPTRLLCADRAYATLLLGHLFNRHGIPVKAIPQGPVTLNGPMVELERLLLNGTLRHDGNPILAWNVQNANARRNSTGLIHLDKSSRTQRIDGLAAVINAIAGYLSGSEEGGSSVFNTEKPWFI